MLRSVLVVLREWAMSVYSQRMGSSAAGHSLILGGGFSSERTIASQGIRDKITSAANRLTSCIHLINLVLLTFIVDIISINLIERGIVLCICSLIDMHHVVLADFSNLPFFNLCTRSHLPLYRYIVYIQL